MLNNLVIRDKLFLLLLLLIPLIFWIKNRNREEPGLHFPDLSHLKDISQSWKNRLGFVIPLLRGLVLILLILALARPQLGISKKRVKDKGIDIMMAVDISSSMLAEDFTHKGERMNRLAVVKRVLNDFIPRRLNDRLGMICFAKRPYTLAPLTWDQDWLSQRLEDLEVGMIEDGTAIGSAIMSSVNRLKDSEAKSKVLILLTDGVNNTGEIQPMMAAETASALNVKIYTIGAGKKGPVPYPVKNSFGQKMGYQRVNIDIDEELLEQVAQKTGGQYFRATDTGELYQIYRQIDQLEKTEIEKTEFFRYKELYPHLILIALFLLGLEIILKNTVMRRLP